jgi:hypothetical protein
MVLAVLSVLTLWLIPKLWRFIGALFARLRGKTALRAASVEDPTSPTPDV